MIRGLIVGLVAGVLAVAAWRSWRASQLLEAAGRSYLDVIGALQGRAGGPPPPQPTLADELRESLAELLWRAGVRPAVTAPAWPAESRHTPAQGLDTEQLQQDGAQ